MTTTKPAMRLGLPDLGCGLGLRIPHYPEVLVDDPAAAPAVDFFEIISENFMVRGGRPLRNLERALELYPIVQHGVSLGIGAATPLDWDYLAKLKELVRRVRPPWLTDHFCWSRNAHADLHDLLPLPYTEEAVRHVAERVRVVQDYLETRVGLENTSSYLTYRASTMTEWDFVTAVLEEADCGILLDVNNVYVSAYNHGFEPRVFLDAIPAQRVLQYHLAGHTHKGAYILDTHDDHVIDEVWELYRYSCRRTGDVSTIVEWDDHIPALEVVHGEALKAKAIRQEVARDSHAA